MSGPNQETPLDALAQRFLQFGAMEECLPSSLYAHLTTRIAADPEILALAAHSRPG